MRRLFLMGTLALMACRTEKIDIEEDIPGAEGTLIDADGDGFDSSEDCDDNNVTIYPGASELCDGVDNNCDGIVDEDVTTTWYADTDGDGYGDAENSVEDCEAPSGYVPNGTDCDDSTADSYPGAVELCDGIDNDCDGVIDEDVTTTWYADTDDDGYGDADTAIETCDPPSGYVADGTDCNDANDQVNPDEPEICDKIDNDCDGYIDEDVTTTWYADTDSDGYGDADAATEACAAPSGYTDDSTDCDDSAAGVNPGESEICNEIDDDCDGAVDEDVTTTYYADSDSDGYGDADVTTEACAAPSGYTSDSTDCDDSAAGVNPGEAEICNEIDDDCDGAVDEDVTTTYYADSDGDGYGDADVTTEACAAPSGYTSDDTDCDDSAAGVNPGEAEICNEIDDDCDGVVDEDVTTTYYADTDGDGYGDAAVATEACEEPSGYTSDDTDCDDTDEDVSPDGTEVCDEVDNNCDGVVDEDVTTTYYADTDGDGYGDAAVATEACEEPSGYTSDGTDCDDDDEAVNPAMADRCDGKDNDCDDTIDEDATEGALIGSLYGGIFYEIDTDDGSYTSVFSPSPSAVGTYKSNGIASSLDGGPIYIHDHGDDRLLELDVCDESLDEIGDTNIGNTCGITIGPDGELYGIDSSNDTLVLYDTATGEATDVGDLGFNLQNCALAYDCATDTMIGMHVNTSDNTSFLFSIDAETGEATEEVTLDTSITWTSAGLLYDPTTALYYASTESGIYTVDISDGSVSKLVDLDTNNLSYIVDECE